MLDFGNSQLIALGNVYTRIYRLYEGQLESLCQLVPETATILLEYKPQFFAAVLLQSRMALIAVMPQLKEGLQRSKSSCAALTSQLDQCFLWALCKVSSSLDASDCS